MHVSRVLILGIGLVLISGCAMTQKQISQRQTGYDFSVCHDALENLFELQHEG